VVSAFAAFIAGSVIAPGAASLSAVCRFAGTTAFLGYTLALWQMTIWYRRSVTMSLKATFDGLIFAAVTCAVFGWLWPH